jgi:DNA ligase 1
MDYEKICDVYERLEATKKGLEKTFILAEFLEDIKQNPEYIYLLQGRVFPDYDVRELGISLQLAIRAISKASGYKDSIVLEEFKQKGDLGEVALLLVGRKKMQQSLFSSKLSVQKVIENLRKVTSFTGKGTVEQKIGLIVELLHSSTKKEAKYIIRTVLGDLKIGVGSGMIRDAIVECCFKPDNLSQKKEFALKVEEAYNKATDFALVFQNALDKSLDKIFLSPGKPVKVMLYPKAKDAEDAFKIVGRPAAFEFKYDGFRVMINKDEKGNVKIFTRRLEEVSLQFPEIVDYVLSNVNAKSFIIDGEAVGYNPETRKYMDFQAISQRIKRKYDIEKTKKILPVELRLFDIIFLNGDILTNESYEFRRKKLEKITKEERFKICLAEQIVTDSESEAFDFFNKAIEEGQEGLMVKGLDKQYKPGARIGYGVKWKPVDKEFDLVITGAEWGTGKRKGWLTSFDLSCLDDGELREVGKVSTGLKEKEEEGLSFVEMTRLLERLIVEEKGRNIIVRPEVVVSVQYQNIQKSPTYSSGFALRFPRIKRLRPDRSLNDIATIEEIKSELSE